MTAFVAFLRGVGSGGAHKVPMSVLCALASDLGLTGAHTYVNASNLLISSSRRAATLERDLGEAITDECCFDVDVIIRSTTQLRRVLRGNPFADGDPAQVQVAFAQGSLPEDVAVGLDLLRAPHERVRVTPTEVYVDFAGGLGRSRLAESLAVLARPVPLTLRGVRTASTLLTV